MARPRKPASLKKGKSESQAQLKERAEVEEKLMGAVDLVDTVPEYLDKLAQWYYKFLISELEISNILSNLDIPLLEQTSDCLSKMRQCDEILNRDGFIINIIDRYGTNTIKEHPAVATKQKYLNQFRALSTQLGLSPSSRAQLAGMKVSEKETQDDEVLKILNE